MVPSLNYIGTAKLAQRWETRHNGKLAGRAVFMRPHPIQYPLIDGALDFDGDEQWYPRRLWDNC
jgi:hypothetical protein